VAGDILSGCETEVLRLSLANLATFPWIADAVAAGQLTLHGFRFDIHTGELATLQGDDLVPVA
jgi:carbonic anhydrase